MKRRNFLIVVLLFILGGVLACIFFHDRDEPTNDAAIDSPIEPKLKRPVRKNAARSASAKKMNVMTDGLSGGGGEMGYRAQCTKTVSFDERTGILRMESDLMCDGSAEYCINCELNEYGEEVRLTIFQDCGDEPTGCVELERNEYGEVIAASVDDGCDGHPSHCVNYTRNDYGDVVEDHIDRNCNNVVDEGEENTCMAYEYDEDGRIIRQRIGVCGREPTRCADHEYDFAAGIRRETWDSNCDGTVDFCRVKVFPGAPWTGAYLDEPGDVNTFTDKDCKGVWYSCKVYSEDGEKLHQYTSHDVCAQKYEEAVQRNRARR